VEIFLVLGVLAVGVLVLNRVADRSQHASATYADYRPTRAEIEIDLNRAAAGGTGHPWVGGVIAFDYRDQGRLLTRREVEVTSVFSTSGRSYVRGNCRLRGAERNFRMDRMYGDIVDVTSGKVVAHGATMADRSTTTWIPRQRSARTQKARRKRL
jgi:hypothetical protein